MKLILPRKLYCGIKYLNLSNFGKAGGGWIGLLYSKKNITNPRILISGYGFWKTLIHTLRW